MQANIKVKLIKLKELPDAKHPHNIKEGFEISGYFNGPPEINQPFWVSNYFRTSPVVEILEDNVFKTYNSIYRYDITIKHE